MNPTSRIDDLLRALNLPEIVPKRQFANLGVEVFHAGLGSTDPSIDPCMGIDHDLGLAQLKVKMEMLERRFLRLVYQSPEHFFRYGVNSTRPRDLAVPMPYSESQRRRFPEIEKALEQRQTTPVAATDLLALGAPVSLPAYTLVGTSPPAFYEYTSNGWAMGNDERVVERAVLELIERDAFLYCWWTKTCPRKILNFESESEVFRRLKAWAQAEDVMIDLFLVPSESGAYVVAATIRSKDGKRPYFLLALGAALRFVSAVEKAVLELVGLLSAPLEPGLAKKFFYPERFDDNIFTLEHHVMMYALWPQTDGYDFLFLGTEDVSANSCPDLSLPQVLNQLKARGHELYLFEANNPLLSDYSLRLVKAFSSSLLPLDILHRRRPLAHPRLTGLKLNEYPHPIG